MNGKDNEELSIISQKIKLLREESELYKKQWKHRVPCREWEEKGECKHWLQAKYRRFKMDIDATLRDVGLG